jgi:hypothetical protein
MIQLVMEWIFVDLIYGSFAALRAARRRRAFRKGREVKFPGFVLEGPSVTAAARGYLCAGPGTLRSTGQGSPEVVSVQVPLPAPGTPVDLAPEALPKRTWKEHATARYSTSSGFVALSCRPGDRKLLAMILQGNVSGAAPDRG